jgi:hypothetical protein
VLNRCRHDVSDVLKYEHPRPNLGDEAEVLEDGVSAWIAQRSAIPAGAEALTGRTTDHEVNLAVARQCLQFVTREGCHVRLNHLDLRPILLDGLAEDGFEFDSERRVPTCRFKPEVQPHRT